VQPKERSGNCTGETLNQLNGIRPLTKFNDQSISEVTSANVQDGGDCRLCSRPLWILHRRWGVNPIVNAEFVGLAALSLIPNRWLVFSRISFLIFLILALIPFHIFFESSTFRGLDLGSVIGGAIVVSFFFLSLPLSLILSRMRFIRGDKFIFA
jgi:hypothetical protein